YDIPAHHVPSPLALHDALPTYSTAGKKKLLRMGLEPIQAALTTASKIGGWSRREEETSRAELCKWYQEMPVLSPRELAVNGRQRSEEHTSELQSREKLVCRLLL